MQASAHLAAQHAGQGEPLEAHDAVPEHDQPPARQQLIEARRVEHVQAALVRREHLAELLLHTPLWSPCSNNSRLKLLFNQYDAGKQ